jgi:hypothetical protein
MLQGGRRVGGFRPRLGSAERRTNFGGQIGRQELLADRPQEQRVDPAAVGEPDLQLRRCTLTSIVSAGISSRRKAMGKRPPSRARGKPHQRHVAKNGRMKTAVEQQILRTIVRPLCWVSHEADEPHVAVVVVDRDSELSMSRPKAAIRSRNAWPDQVV